MHAERTRAHEVRGCFREGLKNVSSKVPSPVLLLLQCVRRVYSLEIRFQRSLWTKLSTSQLSSVATSTFLTNILNGV